MNNYKKILNGKAPKEVFLRHLILTLVILVVLLIPMPLGSIFGSEGDWISQHVSVAESLRQAMREQKTLIPQWIGLGGGSSVYDFSYYGLLRPDVVISCFFPQVEMKYIISLYALLSVVIAVNLCFIWLKRQGISPYFALSGAALYACATCFYHAHHQIMFVNYMPFLMLAFMAVDKLLERGKTCPLIISLFFIYVHSYYYAPACLVAVCLYFLYKWKLMQVNDENQCKTSHVFVRFVFCIALSIGLAAVLLLPSGIDILSTKKDGGKSAGKSLSLVDWKLKGMLYTPYGCGLTVLVLFCLLTAIKPLLTSIKRGVKEMGKFCTEKRNVRAVFSLILLAVMFFPAVSLVLNAFLYARAKILIPFLPLLVLVAADVLEEIYHGEINGFYISLIICLATAIGSKWWSVVILECTLLTVWIYTQKKCHLKRVGYLLVFLVPLGFSIGTNSNEEYIYLEDGRQERLVEDFSKLKDENPLYRYNIVMDYFISCNLTMAKNATRTTMYSSVTNAVYSDFYYKIMRNPIRIRNRVALLAGENCFFRYFMGERYLITTDNDIPAGYRMLKSSQGHALVENKHVLPVCYGTSELMSNSAYSRLEYPATMEALCVKTIVEDGSLTDAGGEKFKSHIKKQDVDMFFKGNAVNQLLSHEKEELELTLPLTQTVKNQVILISFDVKSYTGEEVVITINGIKNKLSSKKAPYPNGNHNFTFVISKDEPISELLVQCDKGNYSISNLSVSTMDLQYMEHKSIYVPELKEDGAWGNAGSHNGVGIIAGQINMEDNGYLVTSYPYRSGYHAMVDGKKTELERVNTSFVGFPLSKGSHEFALYYQAPGYQAGLGITMISVIILAVCCLVAFKYSKN
ncbi:MAG: YfhO family protein [Lachnospiraceae bacterium]|nr:YfhO family protein [Lachnospiraceae bacterium]